MEQIAFRMRLNPDQAAGYERRHDAVWPELASMRKESGIDESDGSLFGVLRRPEGHRMDQLPAHEVMRRWWTHMADITATNPDDSPVAVPLRRVFHLR
jgi:L-rhamnose mutarotase